MGVLSLNVGLTICMPSISTFWRKIMTKTTNLLKQVHAGIIRCGCHGHVVQHIIASTA